MTTDKKPWFNKATKTMSDEAAAVMEERGGQYGDSWGDCNWIVLSSVIKNSGVMCNAGEKNSLRAIALAAMIDVKYSRFTGGYKEDTVVDMCNYLQGLAYAMRECDVSEQSEQIEEQPTILA